jgi:hypothetical protein
MKYFSEKDGFVNAECEHCKRILKIKREQAIPNPKGFSLNPPGGVQCLCGSVHHSIAGATQNISVSPGGKMDDLKKPVKHSNYISGFLAICLFVVLPLYAIGHCMFAPEKPLTPEEIAAKQERSDEFDARVWAKVYVMKSLKAPSTADFQNPADFAVQHLKGGKDNPKKDLWKVSGYVDAQNSFGAMIRNRFYVELVTHGDKWMPVKIVVGE